MRGERPRAVAQRDDVIGLAHGAQRAPASVQLRVGALARIGLVVEANELGGLVHGRRLWRAGGARAGSGGLAGRAARSSGRVAKARLSRRTGRRGRAAAGDRCRSLRSRMNPFWIWMQVAIVAFVVIGMIIAIVKLA